MQYAQRLALGVLVLVAGLAPSGSAMPAGGGVLAAQDGLDDRAAAPPTDFYKGSCLPAGLGLEGTYPFVFVGVYVECVPGNDEDARGNSTALANGFGTAVRTMW